MLIIWYNIIYVYYIFLSACSLLLCALRGQKRYNYYYHYYNIISAIAALVCPIQYYYYYYYMVMD